MLGFGTISQCGGQTKLGSEKMTDKITTRLNEEEQERHDWLKDFFGLRDVHGEDSQTLKMSEVVAFNVLRNTFGDKLKDIFKRTGRDELLKLRAIQQERARKCRT